MLKQRILFEGTPGDDIKDAIPVVINKAKESNEDVFLRWNSITIRIWPNSTKEDIIKEYNEGIKTLSLINAKNNGEIIYKKVLADKITHYIMNILNI